MMHSGRGWRAGCALLLLVGVGLVVGIGGWAQSKVVIVDDRGREVVVPLPVERVVVAGPPLYSEVLVDLGAKGLLVGVTDSPDNPPEVADVPGVGPSFPSPSLERIVALEPDVVLGAVFDVRDQLEAAGLTVVTPVGFLTGLSDLVALIRALGAVVSRPVSAELLIGQLSQQVVLTEGAVVQEPPRRAAFLFTSGSNPPFAAGKGSLEGELLARAGGLNVFSDVEGGATVSLEEVIARDPEVIFTDPAQLEAITANPALAGVSAVQSGRVVGIPASRLSSTRVAAALRAMAQALHPGAFAAGVGD